MSAELVEELAHLLDNALTLGLIDDAQVFEQPVKMGPSFFFLHELFHHELFIGHYTFFDKCTVFHFIDRK